MYNHKEKTAHIRKLIKQHGIKARVQLHNSCGTKYIQVFGTSYEARFTPSEIEMIAHIAECNNLTGSCGSKIVPKHERLLTEKTQWNFEFHGVAL